MKEVRILVAGFGGQGILLLGRLIAYSGMLEGKEVTCFPSYGAEVRGGTANSTVIVSDEMIGSPIVQNPDIFIAMNEASLKRFQPRLKTKGLLIFDSSLIKSPEIRPDVRSLAVPASEMAASVGKTLPGQKGSVLSATQVRAGNMVMLGAFLAETGLVSGENAVNALERLTSAKMKKSLEVNKEAIKRGIEFIAHQKSTDH